MATLGEYLGAGSSKTKLLLHLNGNSADSSGNGNNGTDTNITYSQANGKFGQGAGFNSASPSYIKFPANIVTAFPITISFWYKGTPNGGDIVIGNMVGTPYLTGSFFAVNLSPPKIYFQSRTSSYTDNSIGSADVSLGSGWNNIIMVIQTGTNNLKMFLNGLNIYTGTMINSDYLNSQQWMMGGFYDNGYNQKLTGAVDEMIVENIAWSAEKVKKYYTYAKGRFGII